MRGSIRSSSTLALAIASTFSMLACPGDDGSAGGEATEGEDTTAGTTADPDTDGVSGPSTMSTSAGATSSTTLPPGLDSTSDGESGAESAGFITAGNTDGPIGPQPNGAQCATPDECDSGFCYQVPMVGGVCSECTMDADCEMGTCAVDFQIMYAVCTDGSQGSMCDSDRGCMGDLVCEPLVDTGGLFPLDFCSECGEGAPCAGEEICAPVYDTVAFQGYHACAAPQSVPDGGGCPVEGGVGDGTVCTSGACAVANVFMVVDIGVCGECATDDDCTAQQTCTPPVVDMSGITPSVCQ